MAIKRQFIAIPSAQANENLPTPLTILTDLTRTGFPTELFLESKEMESFTCDICLGVYKDPVSLVPCAHSFCQNCTEAVISKASVCF